MTYNILIVDDDENIRKAISLVLKAADRNLMQAESAEKAIELIDSIPFDLVITDLIMGRLTGIDVLRHAKNVNPDAYVIILTGYGDLSSAIDALRLHADDYILKPSEDIEMEERVTRGLDSVSMKKRLKMYEDMLAICCSCKKIRDDEGCEKGAGKWMSVEEYFYKKAHMTPTSTYCPSCAEKAKAELGAKT